jgi:glycogen operon protein
MHVDGFRFDLAPALVRGAQGSVERLGVFFAVIHQDPVLAGIKLIAEPWDLGHGGYQVGNFPVLWREWNGRFRDTVRRFWRGDRSAVADLGYRLTGSSDLFADDGRHPHASINFVTAHDGFTLRDLVSYERKHNLANGERNADGLDDNESQNCGVEGPSDDPEVIVRRRTVARSILATLLVSHGVPMLGMGDEVWRTQQGNNNPYCQDSELTWVDWTPSVDAVAMVAAARALTSLRVEHAVLRRRGFLRGAASATSRGKDITWLRADGSEMGARDWTGEGPAAIAYRLDGDTLDADLDAQRVAGDDSLLVLMNGEPRATEFTLPPAALGAAWRVVFDSADLGRPGARYAAGQECPVHAGGLVILVDVSRESP